MVKLHAINKNDAETNELPSLHGRAMDNLRFIRETMEQSSRFTAVPGYGGVFMGLTAITAAFIASNKSFANDLLTVWLVEAILAFAIGMFATWQKSKITKTALTSAPAKKFALGFLPALICAVVITLGLAKFGQFEAIIPVWILLYGAAIVAGGSVSVSVVPVMGWCFIAVGTICFSLPANYGNLMMALSFGGLHVVFGLIIARRFGG